MKICRFTTAGADARIGMAVGNSHLVDLTAAGIRNLSGLLEHENPLDALRDIERQSLPTLELGQVRLLAPIERQEVWAAGVTYMRSKTARMEESDFSATAYDRVYDAARPEIFFKAVGEKVVATGEPVGIRRDAVWSVPEPELAIVLNSHATIVGYTLGNDMSSRDIEGENLLYLPQAKVYDRSCALAPWIVLGSTEAELRGADIRISITRSGRPVFAGETSIANIKRSFGELVEYLFRSQQFPHGVVLLTGTGIVPPDEFTLEEHDVIEIGMPLVGVLRNTVMIV